MSEPMSEPMNEPMNEQGPPRSPGLRLATAGRLLAVGAALFLLAPAGFT